MPLDESAIETAAPAIAAELPTLLIVGDPRTLNVAREVLIELELGWQVVFAESTFDAHDIPAIRDIDVILVDLGNPQIEGVELVGSLHKQFAHTPIVLMTAPYGVSVALECMRKGATNHFPRDLLDTEPYAILDTLRSLAIESRKNRVALAALDNQYFEFTLSNNRADVPAIAARLIGAVVETRLCDRPTATRIGVALEEAMLNAIIHGNLEVESELRQVDEATYDREIELRRGQHPYAERRVKVTARISDKVGAFVIQDEGLGFDVNLVPDPTDPENLCRIGGRGIMLMRAFMSAVHFTDNGRRVTMVKNRG
jgi:CheY-like chemotaxis protein